jgi:hypothetical protein
MDERVRDVAPWVLGALVLVGVAYQRHMFGWGAHEMSGPARAIALAGGGTSDGDKCGVKGFHHFVLPSASAIADGQSGTLPGPQLVLGSYGFGTTSPNDPGHFTVDLDLGPGGKQPMDLSPPLGPQGVAVEIEGPNGLIGGAYGLPVTFDEATGQNHDGKIRIGSATGGEAELTIPAAALCPGYNGADVQRKLVPPVDSTSTITGQPPYTITVSIADPAISSLRKILKSTVTGDVLSADNAVP